MRFVRRHPRLAGIVLAAVGLVMGSQSLREARALTGFIDGTVVQARVVSISDVGVVTPDFRLHATWTDANGVEHAGSARAFKRDATQLRTGDAVELRVAADSERVMLQRSYRSAGLLPLGPLAATPMTLVALMLILSGMFLVATGNVFLRSPG